MGTGGMGTGGMGGRGGAGGATSVDAGPRDAGRDGAAGAGTGGTPAVPCPTTAPYFPFKLGNTWTHQVTEGTMVWKKVQTLERMEAVPAYFDRVRGKPALVAVTMKGTNLLDRTVSWQIKEGTKIVRHAEEAYSNVTGKWNHRDQWVPSRHRFDEIWATKPAGFVFREAFTEVSLTFGAMTTTTSNTDVWTVEAVDEPCSPLRDSAAYTKTPMLRCLRIKKVDAATPADAGKTYWFARCVGKVKEVGRLNPMLGTLSTEELADYAVSW